MLISLFASYRVKAVYAKYSKIPTISGYTGVEVAQQILQSAGINDVSIHEHPKTLADHYDPIHKRLVLSSANYHGRSPAALGVSAHECGHAIQHKAAYAPLNMRMAAVGAVNFVNPITSFLPILGFLGVFPWKPLMVVLALAWGVIMLFNLVTLPVEYDASRRAKVILDNMGFLRTAEEKSAVSKVLNAAALTYVAAFLTSLGYFLWHFLPLLLGGNRD